MNYIYRVTITQNDEEEAVKYFSSLALANTYADRVERVLEGTGYRADVCEVAVNAKEKDVYVYLYFMFNVNLKTHKIELYDYELSFLDDDVFPKGKCRAPFMQKYKTDDDDNAYYECSFICLVGEDEEAQAKMLEDTKKRAKKMILMHLDGVKE